MNYKVCPLCSVTGRYTPTKDWAPSFIVPSPMSLGDVTINSPVCPSCKETKLFLNPDDNQYHLRLPIPCAFCLTTVDSYQHAIDSDWKHTFEIPKGSDQVELHVWVCPSCVREHFDYNNDEAICQLK